MECIYCKRTIEQILEQDGEIEISSDEVFACKHCKAIEEHKQWINAMRKMFKVDELEKENQALKDRWEKFKEWVNSDSVGDFDDGYHWVIRLDEILEKMKELEKVNL